MSDHFASDYAGRTPLGLSLTVTKQIGLDDVLSLARLAEERDFDSIWVPETWGTDAGTVLALLASHTERIKIASGVFNVYSRSAALLAQTAASLQDASGGRFVLGLGASGPKVIEDWHGMAYGEPLRRTKEYVTFIRFALAGGRVQVDGRYVRSSGFRLENSPGHPVSIYLAALGPRNVMLAGEMADGWLPIFSPASWLDARLRLLQEGASRAGRSASAVDVASFLPCLVGPKAPDLLRLQVAYYVGGMGSFYARMVAEAGFEADAAAIRGAWQSGDRRAAVEHVGPRLLDACTLGSEVGQIIRRIGVYRAAGVRLPIVSIPRGATAEQVADTIEALSPYQMETFTSSPKIST
ncbi:MAG TPA: LLM class flavin-dependent oxidoreductase [Chloroflexota bacterium]